MNNEFVKVHNEKKTLLLHAAMQWKQQQCRFEIFQISKESYTVSVMICVSDMRRMQLSFYITNSIIQWVLSTKNTYF